MKSSNKIPKMKLTMMLLLFCLLYGVYSYKVETLRPSRDIAKQRRQNLNTFRNITICPPGDKLYNNLSDRHLRPRKTICKKPQISRCRSELAARWSGIFSDSAGGNINREENDNSPRHNTTYKINIYYNITYINCSIKYISKGEGYYGPYNVNSNNTYLNSTVDYFRRKGSRRSGKYLRNVRRRITASTNKCIKRLARKYVNCLTQNKGKIKMIKIIHLLK